MVWYYVLIDYKEYFVEGIEVFFYCNDFYFFVCVEFKMYDLCLEKLFEWIWSNMDMESENN